MIFSGSSSSSWGNVFWERWLQLWRFWKPFATICHGQSCEVELTEGPSLGEIKHNNNNGINLGTQHPTSSNDSEAAVVLFLSDSHAFRMWLSQKKKWGLTRSYPQFDLWHFDLSDQLCGDGSYLHSKPLAILGNLAIHWPAMTPGTTNGGTLDERPLRAMPLTSRSWQRHGRVFECALKIGGLTV